MRDIWEHVKSQREIGKIEERKLLMPGMDLLIFDLDGTLIDSKTDLANSVNATRVHMGLRARGRAKSRRPGWATARRC